MIYGREDCNHVWRYRKDGWEEECIPSICIKCGAFGCYCDFYNKENKPSDDVFFSEGENGNANINGEWINPYIGEK